MAGQLSSSYLNLSCCCCCVYVLFFFQTAKQYLDYVGSTLVTQGGAADA